MRTESTTDLEKFIELYNSIGMPVKAEAYSGNVGKAKLIIKLTAQQYPKLIGYTSFFTEILFDDEGRFILQGIWE